MQAYIWTPLSAAGLALGLLLARKSLPELPPSVLEMVLAFAVIAVAAVPYRLLNVKKRLSSYKAEEAKVEAATDINQTGSPADTVTLPATNPTLISPKLQKAA
jgi:hypothetical protein